MKVAVVIPALDEAGCIADLVTEVLAQGIGDVIVVDNGSSDGTGMIAKRAGARVINEPRRGYGYACAAGAATAHDAKVLVFLDGDYSFSPGEMTALLAPVEEGEADLVLGSRFRGNRQQGAMPIHQLFGNWLVSRLITVLYGVPLTDLGPYRAIKNDLLGTLGMREMTFGWPTEMIVKAARRGARIREVPVSYRLRRSGRSKVGGTWRGTLLSTYHILGVTLRCWTPLRGGRKLAP